MPGRRSKAANVSTSVLTLVVAIALTGAPVWLHFGDRAARSIASTRVASSVAVGSRSVAADTVSPRGEEAWRPGTATDRFGQPVGTYNPVLNNQLQGAEDELAPRPLNASRFTGLWEVSAIAIREELGGLLQFGLHLGKTLGLAAIGKGQPGAVQQLVTDVLVGVLNLPKMLWDRAVMLVSPSSSLEERVDAGTRLAVDIALALVGARGVKVARTQTSKLLYRKWSNDEIITAIAKPRPRGLHRDFWNEMRVSRLQLVLADRIKSQINVQGVRVARKYPWLTRKQYFQSDDVANQLARTAVRKGDDFFDNDHILRLAQGWDMNMAPAGTMLRPTGTVTLRKPSPRFFLPATLPQFRVLGELLNIAPMTNWALGRFSQTAFAKSIGKTVFGNRLVRKVRDAHRGGVQELDYRIVRQRAVGGADATLAARSRALSQPGRVEVDASLRTQLGSSEAVDAVLFEATRNPRLAAALKDGATVRIRAFDPKQPNGAIRVSGKKVDVSPGRRAFELEDDLDLERAVVVSAKSAN